MQWATTTGGLLVTTSNAALWDRYNEPSSVLGAASGIKAVPRARAAITGSPSSSGTCTAAMHSGSVTVPGITASTFNFTASGACNKVETSGGSATKVLGRFGDGSTAVAQSPIGTAGGSHLHFGWLPGLSYFFSNGGRDQELRKMIKTLLVDQLGIIPHVACNTSLVEAPLLLHPDNKTAVITLLNWTASAPVMHGGGGGVGVWRKNRGTADQSMVVKSCGDGHPGNPAWKVADGILGFGLGTAGWVAGGPGENWIVFDLGSSPPLGPPFTNGMGIWSGGDGTHDPKTLVLQKNCQLGSSPCDRVGEWEAKGPPQSTGRQVFDFAPVKTQYFRLEIIDRQSGSKNPSWLGEVEFRVLGGETGPPPPVALQVTGLPFTPATVHSATHGVLSVQIETGTVALFAVPLLHGDILMLAAS